MNPLASLISTHLAHLCPQLSGRELVAERLAEAIEQSFTVQPIPIRHRHARGEKCNAECRVTYVRAGFPDDAPAPEPEPEEPPKVVDLMASLEASLAAVKHRGAPTPGGEGS